MTGRGKPGRKVRPASWREGRQVHALGTLWGTHPAFVPPPHAAIQEAT